MIRMTPHHCQLLQCDYNHKANAQCRNESLIRGKAAVWVREECKDGRHVTVASGQKEWWEVVAVEGGCRLQVATT